MADCSNKHCQALKRVEYPRRSLENAVDAVGNMEAMGPVVIGHRPVVGHHSQYEEDLVQIIF